MRQDKKLDFIQSRRTLVGRLKQRMAMICVVSCFCFQSSHLEIEKSLLTVISPPKQVCLTFAGRKFGGKKERAVHVCQIKKDLPEGPGE